MICSQCGSPQAELYFPGGLLCSACAGARVNKEPVSNAAPASGPWECFCDESYYGLWRVRRQQERSFQDGFHVHNRQDAEALVRLLNAYETELTGLKSISVDYFDTLKAICEKVGYTEEIARAGEAEAGTKVSDGIKLLFDRLKAELALARENAV